jgi:hypothetical protein
MNIQDIFRNPITRRIEEVIKVDLSDEETVAYEIGEYVVTDHIGREFGKLFDTYQESINKPTEATNIWISGFFGSGKSSFAKVLGYVLEDPTVHGKSATDRFLERFGDDRFRALLATIHAQAATFAIFVDLSSAKNVMREGEPIVLPLYRAILRRLDYSTDITLAELELNLEADGDLRAFEKFFAEISGERGTWHDRRNVALARNEASHALHLLRPKTFPAPDSWARSIRELVVNADFFADRVLELVRRRAPRVTRIIFVVDEVGQYVARSVDRMFDLMGLAHAVQKKRGRIWLAVTSQEKLEDVVDSLEGKRVELARVRDRFPRELGVDLIPSDIEEVVSRRVLDKNANGAAEIRDAFRTHRNKLLTNIRLDSPTRQREFSEEEFVRLYPLLPYQVRLFIDAVSAHRARGGAAPMLGGSNRTLIKLAQQFIVHRSTGLGEREVGALATADIAYDLLESIVPTAWQAEVDQVSDRHGPPSLPSRVTKAIALLTDVAALKLNVPNLAALLHLAVDAESLRDQAAEALRSLTEEEVLRQADDGYKLQSPEEKDWERERRGIDMRPAAYVRIRRNAIKELFEGLAVEAERAFRVDLWADGERVTDGELAVWVEDRGPLELDDVRARSREKNTVLFWAYRSSDVTYDAALELHRSNEMLKRREGTPRSAKETELLGEERSRLDRAEKMLRERLAKDLVDGTLYFDGVVEGPPPGDVRTALRTALTPKVHKIYPRLIEFSAPVKRADILAVLRTDTLDGLADYLSEGGLGVVRATPQGPSLALDRDPLAAVRAETVDRSSYGLEATGKYLEEKFGRPPYGATVEVVQVLVAALLRGGMVEAIYQGARIANPRDPRLERAFGTLPGFRATTFVPQREVDPDMRARVAKRVQELTGERPLIAPDQLAAKLRQLFRPDEETAGRVMASLRALGLPVPEAVGRMAKTTAGLRSASDEDVIKTCDDTWLDLVEGRSLVARLENTFDDAALALLREARDIVRRGDKGLDPNARDAVMRLQDSLKITDLTGEMGVIRQLVTQIRKNRDNAWTGVVEALRAGANEGAAHLRVRFAGRVDHDALEEALRPLLGLVPPEKVVAETGPDLEVVQARLDRIGAVEGRVRNQLEEIAARVELVLVRLHDLYEGPVTSEEDLEVLLARIRKAAEEALAQGKHFLLS